VAQRAQGPFRVLSERLGLCRDLGDQPAPARFDTVICLDVLEHLPDPAAQLNEFAGPMNPRALALIELVYFFKGQPRRISFHFDEPALVEAFFETAAERFLEVFRPPADHNPGPTGSGGDSLQPR